MTVWNVEKGGKGCSSDNGFITIVKTNDIGARIHKNSSGLWRTMYNSKVGENNAKKGICAFSPS